MELVELHVLQREAGARRHSQASPVLMKALVELKNMRPSRRGEQRRLGLENRDLAGLHLQRGHASTAPSCGSRIRSSAIHSTKNCVLARRFCW